MKIPVDIEPHLLDYMEGNLSGALLQKVESFVNANPEVLDSLIGMPSLEAPKASIDTSNLIVESDVEELMLEALDGSLSEMQLANLHSQLKESAPLSKEWALFQHTKLTADETVVMPNKGKLLKRGILISMNSSVWYRVAAAVLFLICSGLVYWFTINDRNQTWYYPNTIANVSPWAVESDINVVRKPQAQPLESDQNVTSTYAKNLQTKPKQNSNPSREPIDINPLPIAANMPLVASAENAHIQVNDVPEPVFTFPKEVKDLTVTEANSYSTGLVAYAVKKVRRKLGLQSTPPTAAAINKNELAYLTEKSISALTNGQLNATLHGEKSVSIRSKRLFLEIN